jgi:medium-chain acyl-[acyl-carrier-protein] hydrolase
MSLKKVKLICFPYAGGAPSLFNTWKKALDPNIQLTTIELAGRGSRISEEPYSSLNNLVSDITPQIIQLVTEDDAPTILFGHSMGALIAYETAIMISKLKSPTTLSLCGVVLSAKKPPHLPVESIIHNLPDKEFKETILSMGGVPKEIEGLLPLFLPMLRNDFKMVERYKIPEPRYLLTCPIYIFWGENDSLMNEREVVEWDQYTKDTVECIKFRGGHFFINDCSEEVYANLNSISQSLVYKKLHDV